jgi:hypothetical protein
LQRAVILVALTVEITGRPATDVMQFARDDAQAFAA